MKQQPIITGNKKMVILFILLNLTPSCAPVKIVSAKLNNDNSIELQQGSIKFYAFARHINKLSLLFKYSLHDTVFLSDQSSCARFRDSLQLELKFEDNVRPLIGDGYFVMSILSAQNDLPLGGSIAIYFNDLSDKYHQSIRIDPIIYYIEDKVQFRPFRDKGRDRVSSKGIVINGFNGIVNEFNL